MLVGSSYLQRVTGSLNTGRLDKKETIEGVDEAEGGRWREAVEGWEQGTVGSFECSGAAEGQEDARWWGTLVRLALPTRRPVIYCTVPILLLLLYQSYFSFALCSHDIMILHPRQAEGPGTCSIYMQSAAQVVVHPTMAIGGGIAGRP